MINYLPLNVIENPFRQLKKTVNFTILSLLMSTLALGQTYFPASHSIPWEQRTPGWVKTNITESSLENARLSPEQSAQNIYNFLKSDFKNGTFWDSERGIMLHW